MTSVFPNKIYIMKFFYFKFSHKKIFYFDFFIKIKFNITLIHSITLYVFLKWVLTNHISFINFFKNNKFEHMELDDIGSKKITY